VFSGTADQGMHDVSYVLRNVHVCTCTSMIIHTKYCSVLIGWQVDGFRSFDFPNDWKPKGKVSDVCMHDSYNARCMMYDVWCMMYIWCMMYVYDSWCMMHDWRCMSQVWSDWQSLKMKCTSQPEEMTVADFNLATDIFVVKPAIDCVHHSF